MGCCYGCDSYGLIKADPGQVGCPGPDVVDCIITLSKHKVITGAGAGAQLKLPIGV